jgi:PAS domain S-box-containing protein
MMGRRSPVAHCCGKDRQVRVGMESELSRVVDALPGLIWTALPDGNVDFVNRSWCGYTGGGLDEARGQGWLSSVHPADLSELLECWRSILASGAPRDMLARLRRFDGEYRQFLLRVGPLTDDLGRIIRWCGVNTEIEGRAPLDHGRQNSETGLLKFIDAIPALVALMTPEGAVEFVNRQNREYLGATLEDLKGWAASDAVHPDDLPEVIATWMHSVQTGEPYDIEHRIRRADGVYRWFHVRGLPLRGDDGRITHWCVLETDIDDRIRNKALMAGENRLLEMVVRGLSSSHVMEALCQIVEDIVGDCFASVVLMDASGARLECAAAPHLPAGFIDTIASGPVNADLGPGPMAVALNRQVIAADLAIETRWATAGWPAMAMNCGLHGCWATPITATNGNALGALAVYTSQARSPSSRDMALIHRLIHIASIHIERQRSQRSLALALQEVRLSEDRLRAIIDTVPGFVWRAAPDGNVEFLNQRWCDYTGISLEDSLGLAWTSRVHPDDAPSLAAYWQGLLEAGEPGSYEARLRRFDGNYRWFLIRAVPLLDEAGLVLNWYGQNTDIDDRKRAEALLEGEKQLLGLMAGGSPLTQVLTSLCELVQAILDDTLCSVVLTDARQKRSLTGAPLRLQPGAAPDVPDGLLEEADGRPLEAETSPISLAATLCEPVILADLEREERWNAWRSTALMHGIHASWSTPIMSNCGKVRGVLSILYRQENAPSPEQQGLIAQFTHLASIAIERTHAVAALKQSEAFLAKAQQLSATGALSWRVATDEITWSEEIYNIYELDPSAPATFELIDTRLHPQDLQSYHEAFTQHRHSGKDFEHEHRLLMPNGTVKYLHLVAHATRDIEGQLEYIAAVQDVTHRRLSEEALGKIRSELAHVSRIATLGTLTASIAHEVNQPLAGIITNASTCLRMLGADPPNIDGARETARRTIRDGNRASDVINRLRALFAKKSLTNEGVDLNEAAHEVIAMLLGDLQRNGVTPQLNFSKDLPLIRGDRVQLQQVILNLILNASEAMSEVTDRPRYVRVSTERNGSDRVRLAVSDSGVGFDPDDAEQLFQSFYTTKSSGMGIGLSVSRSIIESHDGCLWAEANKGLGATFTFSIPHLPGRETTIVETDSPQSGTSEDANQATGSI